MDVPRLQQVPLVHCALEDEELEDEELEEELEEELLLLLEEL